MPRLVCLSILLAACAGAAPEIRSILNAGSYALPSMPNSAIAQGSIFVIFGTNLGPVSLRQPSGFPLPTNLGGTSVRVTSGSTSLDAPLLYVWEKQVAAIMPSGIPVGIGLVAVTYEGRTSQSGAIRVVRSSPGILTQNQAGTGLALAQNFLSDMDQPRNTLGRPARPGQTVILWATGLGPVTGSDAVQPAPRDLDTPVEVLVGGRPATVRYKGRSSCCAGADQINFEVPRDVEGCYVPVMVRAGGIPSNIATISVAPAGADCTDLTGLTGAEIERLQSGGEIRFGSIGLFVNRYTEMSGEAPGYYEFGHAEFARLEWNMLRSRVPVGRPPAGSCVISPETDLPFIDWAPPVPLEAGAAVTVNGPKGSRQLPRRSPGFYNESFATAATQLQYLEPGAYTVENGSGGADVGAFRAALTIPPALSTTVRQSGMETTVTWTGGSPDGLVTISGVGPAAFPRSAPGFLCTERVNAGRFTVPSYVFASFSADMTLTVNAAPALHLAQHRFRASGLDLAYVLFSFSVQ